MLNNTELKNLVTEALDSISGMMKEELTSAYYFYMAEKTQKTSGIYFIKNKYTGLMKIACTSDIKSKYSELNELFKSHFGVDDALQMVGFLLIAPQYITEIEDMVHISLTDKRKDGDWFDISENDMLDSWLFGDVVLNNGVRITSVFDDDVYDIIDYRVHLLSAECILEEYDFFKWLESNYRGSNPIYEKIGLVVDDISPTALSWNMI